jgi:hypothetical protein
MSRHSIHRNSLPFSLEIDPAVNALIAGARSVGAQRTPRYRRGMELSPRSSAYTRKVSTMDKMKISYNCVIS